MNSLDNNAEQLIKKVWYKQLWVIILSFILFFPVGIVLLWLSDFSRKSKIWWSIGVTIFLLVSILAAANAAPSITVDKPQNNTTGTAESVSVEGHIYPESSTATLNGKHMALAADGGFKQSVKLSEGVNQISISAMAHNKTSVTNIKVTRTKAAAVNKVTPRTKEAVKSVVAPKPLTIEDQLWKAVDAGLKTRKNIKISYDSSDQGDKIAYIEHTDSDPFDSQSFIRQSFSILVLFGQQAFNIDGVDSINVQNKTNFTDQYGNKALDSGVIIDMHKSEFKKFNWSNLDHLPVRRQIQNASDVFIIKPALSPYTDDQLYLTFHL